MGDRVDSWRDPVGGFTGVNILDFIRSLASTAFDAGSRHRQGCHGIFWGRWFCRLLLAATLLGVGVVHGVSLVAPLCRLLEIALAAVDLVLF